MWLDFTTKYGKKASVQISKADYAQLLKRFSVAGAEGEEETDCPFCINAKSDCENCILAKALLRLHDTRIYRSCIHLLPGLEEACMAIDCLYVDKLDKEVYCNTARHNKAIRTLRNFRRRIMRAARSE